MASGCRRPIWGSTRSPRSVRPCWNCGRWPRSIGVVAGQVGSFGGMSIAAGLCTRLIITPQGRIGLNGPAVIEQEAGVDEFDSSDRALIWAVDGGEQRHATGLADTLVPDDVDRAPRRRSSRRVAAGVRPAGQHRSERLDVLASRLALLDPANPPTPQELRGMWGRDDAPIEPSPGAAAHAAPARLAGVAHGWPRWRGTEPTPVIPSVLRADTGDGAYLAVVPDPDNPFHRARSGEVGLTESLALAQAIRRGRSPRTPPPRSGGRSSPSSTCPARPTAASRRWPGCIRPSPPRWTPTPPPASPGTRWSRSWSGKALSGGFLAHGLQAQQILALDDPGVVIHAMHKAAAARITLRTVDELDELGKTIAPAVSYDVRDWAKLGFCDGLLAVQNADARPPRTSAVVGGAVTAAVGAAPDAGRAICPTGSTRAAAVTGPRRLPQGSRRYGRTMAGLIQPAPARPAAARSPWTPRRRTLHPGLWRRPARRPMGGRTQGRRIRGPGRRSACAAQPGHSDSRCKSRKPQ